MTQLTTPQDQQSEEEQHTRCGNEHQNKQRYQVGRAEFPHANIHTKDDECNARPILTTQAIGKEKAYAESCLELRKQPELITM